MPARFKKTLFMHSGTLWLPAVLFHLQANAEGITEDLGTDAMQLFDMAQPKLMGDGDNDEEEPEAVQDPPSAQPETEARAESTPRESAEPLAGGASRKVSRRKTAPAKSVPSEYQAEPPQVRVCLLFMDQGMQCSARYGVMRG